MMLTLQIRNSRMWIMRRKEPCDSQENKNKSRPAHMQGQLMLDLTRVNNKVFFSKITKLKNKDTFVGGIERRGTSQVIEAQFMAKLFK